MVLSSRWAVFVFFFGFLHDVFGELCENNVFLVAIFFFGFLHDVFGKLYENNVFLAADGVLELTLRSNFF